MLLRGNLRPHAVSLTLAVALFASIDTAYGWGEEGHSIIAEIAQRRLDASASNLVSALLGPNSSLAAVASWADDMRSAHPETANWHFVDIPRDSSEYDEARDCASSPAGDCIVKELARVRNTLACSADVDAKRDALRFAVHFLGDIHQPLHAIKEQRGANLVKVQGEIHGATCQSQCQLGGQDSANLHMVWDTTLIRRTFYDWGAYVDRLEQAWLKTEGFQLRLSGETPVDWAMQSHALAPLIWNDALVPPDGTLSDSYYKAVLPILDQQLALGGLRLARFLNDVADAGCGATPTPSAGAPGGESGLQRYANVGDAEIQASAYHAAGADGGPSRYQQDQAVVGDAAVAYLTQRVSSVTRPAIVLDIDETSLDNWVEIHANNYGYIPEGDCDLSKPGTACGVKAWDKSLQATAIASTLKLFKAARERGVAVFFITGRKETERAATEDNLKRAGYAGWTQVIMEPAGGKSPPSAADFKAPQRARIVMQGYTILVNVGDQPSDLAGGYAERSFLMPNPFYRIP
jgi:hypothetical protein